MKTEEEINRAITDITTKIQNKYPELVKYLDEMPVTIPTGEPEDVRKKQLKAYYDSLLNLVEKYKEEHRGQ